MHEGPLRKASQAIMKIIKQRLELYKNKIAAWWQRKEVNHGRNRDNGK